MSYTKEDIIRIVKEEDIEFIRMQFVDIFGQLKNVAITASQIEKAVNNQITFDGSSIEGYTRINESDQYLYPDLNSFAIFPWRPAQGKVARLICDVYNPDGTPFVGDPRGVLRRVLQRSRDMGFDAFNIGPELEFFLFETDDQGHATTLTRDEAGYFDLGPLDHGESTRREICLNLEQMGFEIEASHHECARGQHEIDFKYDEALDCADKIMTFKLAVKSLAQKNGLHATFMPKPLFGLAGSGMHINMSLFRDGKNIFFDEKGEKQLSSLAYSFIAGLLEHVKGFTALTNPWSTLTSGWSPATRLPATAPGPPPTAPPSSASPPPGASPPGWSCAALTPPATPIWRWPPAWPPAWTASSGASPLPLRSPATSMRWTTAPGPPAASRPCPPPWRRPCGRWRPTPSSWTCWAAMWPLTTSTAR